MPLSVAAFYTEEPKYIERVALLFRTFFTDPETAMSPTMEFDDYEPGRKGPPGYNVGGTIDIARFHATLDTDGDATARPVSDVLKNSVLCCRFKGAFNQG